MKKHFKTTVALMLAIVFVLAFASCGVAGNGGESALDGDFDVNLLASENTSGVPAGDVFDDSEDYRVRFVYSYTAKVVNANGRTEYKKETKTVASIYVPFDNTGFTAEDKAKFESLSYNGYSFAGWYTGWNTDTQTPVEGTEFVVPETAITSDITVYGARGNLAGANATWVVGPEDADGNVIEGKTDAELQELTSLVVKISGEGAMFNFTNANEIDIPWYKYSNRITKVVIGEGITEIGANSFNGLTKMKTIDFGENSTVTKINSLAFNGCTSASFRTLKTPASLVTIGDNAFSNTKLQELVLNEGLKTISNKAFYGSSSIKSAVVPASLETVAEGAFHPGPSPTNPSAIGTHKFSRVYYLGTPEQFAAIKIGLDNTWFDKQPTIYYFTNDAEVGENPDAEYPYWHYAEVNGVVTDIPAQYCYTVRYFVPGDNVTPIASIRVPVEAQWTYDEFGELVLDINPDTGELVLAGVVDQAIINKQDAITYRGYKFYWANTGLTLGTVLKDDTKYTCDRGVLLSEFGGVVKATGVESNVLSVEIAENVEKNIRNGVAAMVARGEILPDYAEDGETVTKTVAEKAEALVAERLEAAYKIWDFENALVMDSTFWGVALNNITEVKIADGITYIGSFTFSGLTSLTSVVIPSSVVGIAANAFDGCANLAAIYYEGADVALCEGLDSLTGNTAAVYAKAYGPTTEAGDYWMDVDGKKLAWSLSFDEDGKGALIIGGADDMVDLPHSSYAPWAAAKDSITKVSFARNIVALGENIINGYNKVTEISLPRVLKVIPESALAGTALVNDTLAYPNGVLMIDGHLIKVDAARRNTNLFETVHGVISIAEGAFEGCDAIKRLFIAATTAYINDGAFPVSDIEYVFVDGAPSSWASIAADAYLGFNTQVFFRSDSKPTASTSEYKYYVKTGSDYAIWGCNCVFGKWVRTTEPTCMATGVDTRYCIYDDRHTETREVAKLDTHVYSTAYRAVSGATCVTPGTKAHFCTVRGCTAHDEPVVDDTKPAFGSHYYEAAYTYAADGTVTCTLSCIRSCCRPDSSGNTLPGAVVVHSGLVWQVVTAATVDTEATGYFICSVEGCKEHGTEEAPIVFPFHTHVYSYAYVLEEDGYYTCTLTCERAECKDATTKPDGAVDTHYNLVWVPTSEATDTSPAKGYFTCDYCDNHGDADHVIDYPITPATEEDAE